MNRNYALIEQVWQYIQDHPRQHRQRVWLETRDIPCGTVACFAGWATLLSGYRQNGFQTVERGSEMGAVRTTAMTLLGLSHKEGQVLFNGSNSRPMLALMVKDLLNGDELQGPKFYRKLRKEQIAAERAALERGLV